MIVFRKLERADLVKIVNLELKKVIDRLKEQGKTLEIEPAVVDFIIEKGFQPEYGARPLRRAIERYIEDELADSILRGLLGDAGRIVARRDNDKIVFFPGEEEPDSSARMPKESPVHKELPPAEKKTTGRKPSSGKSSSGTGASAKKNGKKKDHGGAE